MKKFGFLIHPFTISELKNYWPMVRIVPDFIIKSSFKNIRPISLSHVSKVSSLRGLSVEGHCILCPFLPEEILAEESGNFYKKINDIWEMVARMQIDIIGLGGYLSFMPERAFNSCMQGKVPGDDWQRACGMVCF